jgi:hypothetical protein
VVPSLVPLFLELQITRKHLYHWIYFIKIEKNHIIFKNINPISFEMGFARRLVYCKGCMCDGVISTAVEIYGLIRLT